MMITSLSIITRRCEIKTTSLNSLVDSSEFSAASHRTRIDIDALRTPSTKDKYIQSLTKFFNFLDYQGTKEENA
jgi:hypothetical protein